MHRRSSLGMERLSNLGGGDGEVGVEHTSTVVQAWRIRAHALREEAERMLALRPMRKRPPGLYKLGPPSADPEAPGDLARDGPWVNTYLLYEPLQIGESGHMQLVGALGEMARQAGGLFTATFTAGGAADAARTRLSIRLFVEAAPACVGYIHELLAGGVGAGLGCDVSGADAVSDADAVKVALPCGVAATVAEGVGASAAALACGRPDSKRTAREWMDEELAELVTLPHAHAGLVSYLPTSAAASAPAPTAGVIAFALGTTPPFGGERAVIIGRIIAGHRELVHIARAGGSVRLVGWQKASPEVSGARA